MDKICPDQVATFWCNQWSPCPSAKKLQFLIDCTHWSWCIGLDLCLISLLHVYMFFCPVVSFRPGFDLVPRQLDRGLSFVFWQFLQDGHRVAWHVWKDIAYLCNLYAFFYLCTLQKSSQPGPTLISSSIFQICAETFPEGIKWLKKEERTATGYILLNDLSQCAWQLIYLPRSMMH